MNDLRTTVLLAGAGGPGAVNMTRSLKLGGVRTVGGDASPWFIHLAETDVRANLPRWSDEDAFVAAIRSLVDAEGVDFIMPNNSVEGEIYSRRRDALGAPVFLPSPEAFAVGESKWLSWHRFRDAGLPVPRTELVEKAEDVHRIFREIETRPLWVRGAGIPGKGVGMASLPCKTAAQAEQWVDYWDGWGGMIVSEFLPGDNLTWLGVFDRGEVVASQGRQRDAYVIPHVSPSGITGAPAVCHTVHRADINRLGPLAVRAVDPAYTGPAFVDFKGDREGAPQITEINVGRFGTTHHFYSVAGANFPLLVLALGLGHALPAWTRTKDVLPAGLYWIRTLDAGPVLIREDELTRQGCHPPRFR